MPGSYLNQEFIEGQTVTFKPYETETLLQVISVSNRDVWGNQVNLPIYHLGKFTTVTNVTSGKSIMESEHFEEYTGEGADE